MLTGVVATVLVVVTPGAGQVVPFPAGFRTHRIPTNGTTLFVRTGGVGPAVVLLTRGGEGSSAYGRQASASAEAPKVDVVDTVGAGDAFMSGTLAWLYHNERLEATRLAELSSEALAELLRYAGRTSALTVSRAGADPPTESELAAFL